MYCKVVRPQSPSNSVCASFLFLKKPPLFFFFLSPQGKTFSILAEKHETVARARGHFLHVLHSQGLTDMPCRFALDNTDQELLKDTDIIGDCVEDKADAPARLKFFVDPRPPPPPELRPASQAITSLWPMAKKVNQVEKARLSAKSEVTVRVGEGTPPLFLLFFLKKKTLPFFFPVVGVEEKLVWMYMFSNFRLCLCVRASLFADVHARTIVRLRVRVLLRCAF